MPMGVVVGVSVMPGVLCPEVSAVFCSSRAASSACMEGGRVSGSVGSNSGGSGSNRGGDVC